jgi:outer membrane protein insertion porin family
MLLGAVIARYAMRWLPLLTLLLLALCVKVAHAQPGPEPAPQDPAAAPEEDIPPPLVPELPATEAELARGLPILSIEVTGNRRISEDDVRGLLKQKVGGPFAPEVLTQDVRELFASGYFEDIEVDLARTDAGVVLRFLVRERPTVAAIEFQGNDEISSDDLAEGIELKTTTVLSNPAIRRSVQKIRDMYAEQGYYLAEVESEVVPQRDNEVLVRFRVTEYNKVSVRRITFIGNDSIPDSELREVMFTGASNLLAFGSGGPFRQDAFERDIAVITGLYYDRGFLNISIATPRVMLTPDRSGIEITLTINEGPRYRIRQLRVYERGPDGKEVEPIGGRRNLRMMVRAEPGDYFNRAQLVEDIQAIQTLYRDHGYANVRAQPEPETDPARPEVDIVVPVERGPLVYFGRIEFRGNTKTRDKVIRRELEIREGELSSETGLRRSRDRVTALGYFERVDVSTAEGSEPNTLDVFFEVTERPTGTFQVGAGFSSIENFIATAQVQQANLSGNGQSLSLQAQVSQLRQLVNLRIFEPYFLDSRFSASLDLYNQLRSYDDYSESNQGGAITFGYPLVEPELTASLTYTLELNEISTQPQSTLFGTASGISVFRRLPLANLFNDGITSSIRPTLTYDTRNNRLFPTSGIYLRGSTELAAAALGSENEFIRNRLVGRFFYPLGNNVVLKLNTEAGVVTSPTQEGVPIFTRFFLGGILDVRGFPFRSLGPRMPLTRTTDPTSPPITNFAPIGGNMMYFQNLELEVPVVEAVGLRAVLFTDAGNAWNLEGVYCRTGGAAVPYREINPCFDGLESLAALRTSWGAGLRWFSPLGPLRFEWGFPFKPLPYEESMVFEFTIGNFF